MTELAEIEPVEGCECDNTHEAVGTVCRWCWARGRRRWDDPEVERIPANDAGEDS